MRYRNANPCCIQLFFILLRNYFSLSLSLSLCLSLSLSLSQPSCRRSMPRPRRPFLMCVYNARCYTPHISFFAIFSFAISPPPFSFSITFPSPSLFLSRPLFLLLSLFLSFFLSSPYLFFLFLFSNILACVVPRTAQLSGPEICAVLHFRI